MVIELELNTKKKVVSTKNPQSVSSLSNGFYGSMKKGIITLEPEEILYLLDIRNANCIDKNQNNINFNQLSSVFSETKHLLTRYFTYASWRDRGLIIRSVKDIERKYNYNSIKKYPQGAYLPSKISATAHFFPDDLYSVIDDKDSAKFLYDNGWFGQFATYKADQRGRLGKLDAYETIFLMKHANLKVDNANEKKIISTAIKRRPDFKSLYDVYEDWRLNGFILKTGFKFGTHFRIYFPGASPKKGKGWVHSEHVLQVFPRTSKLLISEWARAIRLAHSVRKTFVLAINGQRKKSIKEKHDLKTNLDFLLYHRKGQDIYTPKNGDPKYLMLSLSEEEYLSGAHLAKAIDECKKIGLELILAIVDRETSVTHYAVKRISIPDSEYEYYEIEWVQP